MAYYEVLLSSDGKHLATVPLGAECQWNWNLGWDYGWAVVSAATPEEAIAAADALRVAAKAHRPERQS